MKLFMVFLIKFSSLAAFSAEVYGTFYIVKGDIKVSKKDAAPAAVKNRDKVFVGDTVISGADSRAKIVMSDRNIINVSPETKVLIEEYSNSKNGKNVKLSLIEGKIRNNVQQKYDGEKDKFQVRTPTAVAGVRGTDFMTSFSSSSRNTEIVTFSGVVMLQSLNNVGEIMPDIVTIKVGERSQSSTGAAPAPPAPVPKNELKQIDSETAIPPERVGQQPNSNSATAPSSVTADPNAKKDTAATLDEIKKRTSQQVQDTVTKKVDKTNVKVTPVKPTGENGRD